MRALFSDQTPSVDRPSIFLAGPLAILERLGFSGAVR
jgi:hypothetical protein